MKSDLPTRTVEHLIIGGGFAGCITAWILNSKNLQGILLERGPKTSGMNGSFEDSAGNWFDYGRHVLNYGRSDLATRYFLHTLNGPSRKFTLSRGILLRGTLIPYARPVDEWPAELREKIRVDPDAPLVRLGSTRREFASAYGSWFSDLIFDEVIHAFPTLSWRLEHGERAELLLDWIFPWFFPLSECEGAPDEASERGVFSAESRRYHYDTRHGDGEEVLYPSGGGGFGQWLDDVIAASAPGIEVRAGLGQIDFDMDAESCRLLAVRTSDCRYVPRRAYWCAPIATLCRELGWELPSGEPQTLMIASFSFEEPLDSTYHEILCGDPTYRIRRISFPGLISGADRPGTVQVEHLELAKQADSMDGGAWLEHWERSLRSIGLVSPGNRLLHADLKKLPAGVATCADLAAFAQECQSRLRETSTNLVVPGLTCTPDNLSRRLPIIFADVCESLGLPSEPLLEVEKEMTT